MLAVRSSEVAAEASGIAVNRTKIMIFALSAAIAGFGGALLGIFSFSSPTPPRRRSSGCSGSRSPSRSASAAPAARCSPASRSPAAPPSSTGSRRGRSSAAATCSALITSIYFVPDPVGPRRHPARPGARRHPRARRPAEAPQEAREGAPGAHRRGRSRGRTAAWCRSTSVQHTDRRRASALPRSPTERLVGRDAGRGRGARAARAWSRATATPRSSTASTCASSVARSPRCSAPTAPASRRSARSRRDRRRRRRYGVPRRHDDHRRRVVPACPAGVLLVPEARGIFPGLTVEENLDGAPARRPSSARTPTSGSRSSPSGASRSPVCSPAASSRCSASHPPSPTRRSC